EAMVRRDLDRLVSCQHVVPPVDGCHLKATLVDFVHPPRCGHTTPGLTAAEESGNHLHPSARASGLRGAVSPKQLLNKPLRCELCDLVCDSSKQVSKCVSDRLGTLRHIVEEPLELASHPINQFDLVKRLFDLPVSLYDGVSVLLDRLFLKTTQLDCRR